MLAAVRPTEMRFGVAAMCVLALGTTVSASPAWDFAGLLARAQSVAVVTVEAHDGAIVTFAPTTVVRGSFSPHKKLRFRTDAAFDAGVTHYVAISQGDPARGPPTSDARIGQGIEGQAGFRGWLLYPVRTLHGREQIDPTLLIGDDGAIALDHLAAVVKKSPYRDHGP